MLKLLIVDDEFVIRNGLVKGVDWASLHIQLLPAAESAEEALKTAQSTLPDILITDISMPGKSGIELIGALEKLNPRLKSIILTGYDDFEYAKQAVDLKVCKYLLKPVAPDILLETVRSLQEELEENIHQQEEFALLRQKFVDNFDTMREFFLNSVLLRRYSENTQVSTEQNLFCIGAGKSHFGVLITQFEEDASGENQHLDFLALAEITKHLSDEQTELYPVYLSAMQYAIVVCGTRADILTHLGEQLLYPLQNTLHKKITVGISNMYNSFPQISLAFEEAREAASYRLLTDRNALISIQDILPESDSLILFPQQELEKLIAALKNRNATKFSKLIQELFLPLKQCKRISLAYALQLTVEFLSTTLRVAEQYSIPLGISEPRELWTWVFAADTLEQLEAAMQKVYHSIAQQIVQQDGAALIEQIKAYLEQNYTRKLNLTEVSQHFYLSYSYLSLLFKRETGYNISEYLNQLRISHAKQLLADSATKVYEIGALVGIEDSHYFTRIFKKQTGLTPSQYREQLENDK